MLTKATFSDSLEWPLYTLYIYFLIFSQTDIRSMLSKLCQLFVYLFMIHTKLLRNLYNVYKYDSC